MTWVGVNLLLAFSSGRRMVLDPLSGIIVVELTSAGVAASDSASDCSDSGDVSGRHACVCVFNRTELTSRVCRACDCAFCE
jgi:hypothetical protein